MKWVLVVVMMLIAGCTAQQLKAVSEGLVASNSYSAPQSKIMIYGGPNNSVYLGCYSCDQYSNDSIFNQYGNFGSKYSNTSIFNSYSEYSSKYSDYGACNQYANNPPVIVDSNGNFYGHLTLNKYHPKATTNGNILAWLSGVCAAS